MKLGDVPASRAACPELVFCLQRELDAVAVGTIITRAVEHQGALRFTLDYPARLNSVQPAEIDRLVDNAQIASRYLALSS